MHFPLVGTSTALDTLLAQSWGARNYGAYREWFRIGVIVLFGLSLIVCVILGCRYISIFSLNVLTFYYNSNRIYKAIGQNPELAQLAGDFCIHLIPGYFPYVLFLALTKYLQTQGILTPSVAVGFVSNLFNAAVNYLLIFYWGLGFEGAPIATSIARWFQLLVLLGYMFWTYPSHSKTWPSLKMPQGLFNKASEFLRLGVPGAMMFGLEGWAFEASTLMATYLDTVSLDAHTILLNTCAFTFMSLAFALGNIN